MGNRSFQISLNLENRFTILYIIILLVAFSPSKALGQFIGLIAVVGLIFFVRIRPNHHIKKYLSILILYTLGGVIYYVLEPDFSFINYFLFLVTISAVLLLFYDFRPVINPRMLNKLSSATLVILVFEGLYGLVQGVASAIREGGFDVSNGDNVRGTIEPSLVSAGLGGNVIFAILISSLLIFVIASSKFKFSTKRAVLYGICLLSWVIASVLHTVLLFGAAVIVAIILIKIPRGSRGIGRQIRNFRTSLIMLMGLVAIFLYTFLPSNLGTIPNFISYNISISPNSYSEKARATYYTLFWLNQDYPLQPLIGIGPGQYSSRASLIRSGEYLKGSSLPLPVYASPATTKYILPLWRSVLLRPGMGSSYFPYYSWMSLYGEMGLLGFLFALYKIINMARNLRRWRSKEFSGLNLGMLILLFYIALLGVQDNYWEFTQAVLPAFFVLSYGYQYLRSEHLAALKQAEALPGLDKASPANSSTTNHGLIVSYGN